jgi:hypothetical protein
MPLLPRQLKIDEEFPDAEWELRIARSKYRAKAPSVIKALGVILKENDILGRLEGKFNARLIGSNGDEYTFKADEALSLLGVKP